MFTLRSYFYVQSMAIEVIGMQEYDVIFYNLLGEPPAPKTKQHNKRTLSKSWLRACKCAYFNISLL